jgi:hypothetical protein
MPEKLERIGITPTHESISVLFPMQPGQETRLSFWFPTDSGFPYIPKRLWFVLEFPSAKGLYQTPGLGFLPTTKTLPFHLLMLGVTNGFCFIGDFVLICPSPCHLRPIIG